MSEGEFHFTLTEKFDKNKRPYLFAGIRILNSVLFIREMPQTPGEPRRFEAILKPYRERSNQSEDDFVDVWDVSNRNPSDNVKQSGDKTDGKREQSPLPQRRPR
jgi:hypothetical protein